MRDVKTNKHRLATRMRYGNESERAEAAAKMVKKRYAKMSPEDWVKFKEYMSSVATGRPRDTSQPRCRCGVMTLKRARARGYEETHKKTCDWHPDHK